MITSHIWVTRNSTSKPPVMSTHTKQATTPGRAPYHSSTLPTRTYINARATSQQLAKTKRKCKQAPEQRQFEHKPLGKPHRSKPALSQIPYANSQSCRRPDTAPTRFRHSSTHHSDAMPSDVRTGGDPIPWELQKPHANDDDDTKIQSDTTTTTHRHQFTNNLQT